LVGLGFVEAWTASLVTETSFFEFAANPLPVRVTNPLSQDEAVLRGSMLPELLGAWAKNVERGQGDVALFEMGVVVEHPGWSTVPRRERGGVGGREKVELPAEHEQAVVLLGRIGDDARTAVATWHVLAERLGLTGIEVRRAVLGAGWHPTRSAEIREPLSSTVLGRVGEIDPDLVERRVPAKSAEQRVGVLEIDLDVIADLVGAPNHTTTIMVPSRFPAANIDLAFTVPRETTAFDLAATLTSAHPMVESVRLFDVFTSEALGPDARSLAFAVRLIAEDHTLSEAEIASARQQLIEAAERAGARLR
jgi:phenylalanyl-tRNA synthetase beta chain